MVIINIVRAEVREKAGEGNTADRDEVTFSKCFHNKMHHNTINTHKLSSIKTVVEMSLLLNSMYTCRKHSDTDALRNRPQHCPISKKRFIKKTQ